MKISGALGRDLRWGPACAVGEFGGDDQLAPAPHAHPGDAFCSHPGITWPSPRVKVKGSLVSQGGVEDLAVAVERPDVVDCDGLPRLRFGAGAGDDFLGHERLGSGSLGGVIVGSTETGRWWE